MLGIILAHAFQADGHQVVILSRGAGSATDGFRRVHWDARTLGAWAAEIDGSDVVINLAGRSVSCRYTAANLKAEMMDSRVRSTESGRGGDRGRRPAATHLVADGAPPPSTPIASTRRTTRQRARSAVMNSASPSYLGLQQFEIAKSWERAQEQARETPHTRKVALRSAMVMSPGPTRRRPRRPVVGLVR